MILQRLPKILLYYLILVVALVVALLAIEGLNIYHFDAQLGMAIVIWGIIGLATLLSLVLIGALIEYIFKKLNTSK